MSETDHYRPLRPDEIEARNRGFSQDHDLMPPEFKDYLKRLIEIMQPTLLSSSIANFGFAVRTTYLGVTSVGNTYTAKDSDNLLLCDLTVGAFTVTLPTAVDRAGKVFYFIKTDASGNALTIDGAGSETINGAATYTAINAQYKKVIIVSDGANWLILGT